MSDAATEIREKIRRYVLDKLEPMEITAVRDDEPLVENGVADSLGIVQLVAFFEETFGIMVDDRDIVPENFLTIDAMVGFVTAKNGAR
jgi:acyl carrier protein